MSTSEKPVSASLRHLEVQLADKNPALLQAFRLYHELDQVAYDLGLIGIDDSLANKTSWSPVITVVGDIHSGSHTFIDRYLDTSTPIIDEQSLNAQFTVLVHREGGVPMTLPGTAVDGDPRFPFFHMSERLDQMEEGEGRNINSYLDLKTNNSQKMKDKTIVLAPGFSPNTREEGVTLIRDHVIDLSDLVFVFFDANQLQVETFHATLKPFFKKAALSYNPGKFIYVINQSSDHSVPVDIMRWKEQLEQLGLEAGQFFALQKNPESTGQKTIEEKLVNIDVESAYRILSTLEQHINDIDRVAIHEVKKAIVLWKDRTHFTLTIILSFIALTLVAGEIQMGLVAVLLDPFVASIFLFLLIIVLIPLHFYSSKIHAKIISKKLALRQSELGLMENLPALFNKGMTFWRILFPIVEPVGWTKEIQETLGIIKTRAQGLVQSLNNSFNSNKLSQDSKEETFLNL